MTDLEIHPAMTARTLDFAVIGAQKCATSWIYYCLRDHPQVCVPDKKLDAGYIGGQMFAEKGEEWFFDRFRPENGQLVGDVSVEYLFDVAAPTILSHYMRAPKLIASLRNPVDRMVSSYYWLVRRGKLENLPLDQGLAPLLDQKPGFPDRVDGPLGEIVRRSCYGPQLTDFLDNFAPETLLVLLYEDIDSDAEATIRGIFQHLGVDDSFRPPSIGAEPKRNSYNPLLLALENRFHRNKVVAKAVDYANQATDYLSPRKRGDILPPAQRKKFAQLFAPAIEETSEVLARLPESQRPTISHLRQTWGEQG